MATHEGFPPVNFLINSPLENIRLIEVSQDIVDIVESAKPALQFKSAEHGILHLCSEDKAWAIKQVSTSNSVYLIQPCSQGVTATSQVRNFLELHPVKIDESEIQSTIISLLPTQSLTRLIENVPAPDSFVRKQCTLLCVVEAEKCILPSSSRILETWERMSQVCAIELIPLDHAINVQHIVDLLQDPIDKAIAIALLRQGGTFDLRGLIEETETRYLKPQETCIFVALLLLQAGSQIDSDAFVSRWTSLVPSSFVKYCTLDTLTQHHVTITEVDGKQMIESSVEDGPLFTRVDGTQREFKAAVVGKRKWHEKFGAQRTAKK